MDENNKSNSLNASCSGLYHEISKEEKAFNSINVYTQIEDEKKKNN